MDLKYTNNRYIIPEGYYRLPIGEIIKNGDFYDCHYYWARTGDGSKNKKVGDNGLIYIRKNKDQKTMNIQYKNGKPLIPEGYCQLFNEDFIKEGDYFNCTSYWALTNDYAKNITVGSNIDKMEDSTIYIRKIYKTNKAEGIQNMNNDLNALEEQKRLLEQQIQETETKIRLEKEKKNKLVVGDYIVCLDNPNRYSDYVVGSVVEVIDIDVDIRAYHAKSAKNEQNTSCFYFSGQNIDWRKATESEVKEYKDKITKEDLKRRFEANKKDMETIKVGEYVVFSVEFSECYGLPPYTFEDGKVYKVTKVYDDKELEVNNEGRYYFKSRFRRATQQEIKDLELKNIKVGDYLIIINLEGVILGNFQVGQLYEVKNLYPEYFDVYNKDNEQYPHKTWHFYKIYLNDNYRKATKEEIMNYQSRFEYKVEKDDFVTNDKSGVMLRVSGEGDNSHWFKVGYESHLKSEWRLATPEEIEYYLRAEAEKKGYKVGVKVQFYGGTYGVIEEIKFMKDSKNFPSGAYTSNKNILYVAWEGAWGMNFAEIDDNLKIIKEESVEVNGYKAEYYKDYIQFGCAKINIDILYKLSMCYEFKGVGNKVLEGDIKIGAGTFNKQTIKKLLKIYEEKFKNQ